MFQSLEISNWRQFEKVSIQFHDRLTIITGANGSGKTTILNILGRHYGWNVNFVSTPKRDPDSGTLKYLTGWVKGLFGLAEATTTKNAIGKLTYEGLPESKLVIPADVSQTYQLQLRPQHHFKGLHISSHRPTYTYQLVGTIPTQPMTKEQAFQNYFGEIYNRFLGSSTGRTPNFIIKETLLSLATFGYGNEVVVANPQARETFERFQQILRIVLPPKIGFERISIQMPEIVLVTKSGEFSLDAVSGGIASIIDIAWQIFMYSPENEPFVVTIDEPENHLHPELQQTLLPSLIKAFPQVQFIAATHNPFMISSVQDSYVYVLDYNANNRVESSRLDTVDKAGTSNEILREVLGLPFTMPIWAEEQLESIIRRFEQLPLSDSTLSQLREELKQAGLERYAPDAVVGVVKGRQGQ